MPAGDYVLTVSGVDEAPEKVDGNYTVVHTPDPAKGDLNILTSMSIIGAGAGQTVIGWALDHRWSMVALAALAFVAAPAPPAPGVLGGALFSGTAELPVNTAALNPPPARPAWAIGSPAQ